MKPSMTIYKYRIPIEDTFVISMPARAIVLSVQDQRGTPCIWAMVNPAFAVEPRRFRLAGTGYPIEDPHPARLNFVGTLQLVDGALTFHLFEVTNA